MTDLISRLRDRDAIVLSGLFHAVPAMREAAAELERAGRVIRNLCSKAEDSPGCIWPKCDCRGKT